MKEAIHGKRPPMDAGRGVPWWIWVVAASFLLYFGLVLYLDFAGPALGVFAGFTRRNIVVNDVFLSAEASGIRREDRIIRADGQLVASDVDWFSILSNLEVGKPISFEVQRGEQHLNLVVTPTRRSFSFGRLNPLMLVVLRIGQSIMLGLACVIAFARPRNPSALIGALFLGTIAVNNPPQLLAGYAAVARDLPAIPLLWIPGLIPSLGAPLFFTFCATFPRKFLRGARVWALLWIPPLSWMVPVVRVAYRTMWDPHHATGLFPEWAVVAVSIVALPYVVAGLLAMAVNYRLLPDANERRRVRVLVLGSVLGVLAGLPLSLTSQPSLTDSLFGDIFLSVPGLVVCLILCYLVFPLSFAYSILRHRLFDVRIIIRQGLQYAMARGVFLSIVPLLAAVLFVDLFIHGNQSLAATLKARGWIYVVLGVLAAVIYQKRREWLDRIDRRFFRDRFDAQRLLQEVIQDLEEAKSLDTAAGEVLTRIQEALHPEFVSLMHHEADEREFRSIACAPVHQTPRLQTNGKLMALLRVVGKPLQISTSAWLADGLPPEEIQVAEEHRVELLVPIRLSSDGAESLLALGPKRSEEPYSREDEKLLSTIAASLALLSRTTAIEEPDTLSFRECPDCGACFNTAASHCHRDGSGLVRVDLPRLLAKRYRLDQRIGRGGMGTIYSGIDQALERQIAIKVIRPELVRNSDLTARFHHEARAAAGIVHRNVVTIHDFGVERQHPFIIMELLAGRTLRTELAAGKPFSPERTLEILDGVCAAIEEAHRRQLLHRDLKPENIFLAETPTGDVVKVLDFGLVKALGTSTLSNAPTALASVLAGTPYYMAPELLLGGAASRSSDVWALGVIAYEMLIGTHPFVTGTAGDWQKAVLNEQFVPDVPQHWETFFERVFQRNPARRTDSARVFRSELELALRNQGSRTQTPG
jgi:hypothetical protein